jgi:hypothetical protein
MAVNIIRRSPVDFDSPVARFDERDNWKVAMAYEDEGDGPWLIDLSHRVRWDLQDQEIEQIQPWGAKVPQTPGRCAYHNGMLVNRMNRTQASLWHLSGSSPEFPGDVGYTDVTDATVFLALIGKNLRVLIEKLTALDFFNPGIQPPFLLQGPLSHVPCQCVMLERSPDRVSLLFTCSRGYAADMVHAVLGAGTEFGLKPAGEAVFNQWINEMSIDG